VWRAATPRPNCAACWSTPRTPSRASFYKTSGYVRPGEGFTTKPAAEPLPPLLTAQQVEDVIAFLLTLKD
jgi:sulfur-oxidizing protein SoxX